jgi:hypothetical protein
MLKIDGNRIMKVTQETPGRKIGDTLLALLEEVLNNPDLNNKEYLEDRAKELIKLPLEDLKKLGEQGQKKKEVKEMGEIKEIRDKYWVK